MYRDNIGIMKNHSESLCQNLRSLALNSCQTDVSVCGRKGTNGEFFASVHAPAVQHKRINFASKVFIYPVEILLKSIQGMQGLSKFFFQSLPGGFQLFDFISQAILH